MVAMERYGLLCRGMVAKERDGLLSRGIVAEERDGLLYVEVCVGVAKNKDW
jgi:hypothetical protein